MFDMHFRDFLLFKGILEIFFDMFKVLNCF